MSSSHSDSYASSLRHSLIALRRLRKRFTFSSLVRVLLVTLLVTGYAVTCVSVMTSQAYAATHARAAATSRLVQQAPRQASKGQETLSTQGFAHKATPSVSSSAPFDGLGQLPFYTFIKQSITSPTCSCGKKELYVNVANGNLMLHTVEMQIRGTGVDLSIEAYYNSLATYSRDLGPNWTLNIGHDVRVDLSTPNVGISYHGPSGFSAFFAYNSSTGGYSDAPGLNATLTKNSDGTYTLSFHKTGEKLIFGTSTHLIAIKDKNNNTISIAYDTENDITSITDTQGRVINFTHNTNFGIDHDPQGQITSMTDPTGRATGYTYDSYNRLISSSNLDGKSTGYGYTDSDLTQVTDVLGNATAIAYDSSHRVTSITDPLGGKTSFTYNSGNTLVTDANGHATTYTYDAQWKVTKVTDALGHSSSTGYDSTNYNVTSYTDALNNNQTFNFDVNNNLTGITDGNGNKSSIGYANSSLPYYPTSSTDEQSHTLSYAYDAVGNVTSTSDQLSSQNKVSYSYNSNGTIASVTDADAHTTSYGYDGSGNLSSITPPSPLGSESITHDSLSRVTSVTDGKGQKTSFTYNKLDKITSITYADGSTINYSYDGDGNQTSLVDNTGTTTFTFDALNRMTKKTLPGGATISYTYDAVGNLTSYADAGGTVKYAYNAVNLLTTLIEPSGAQTTYTYDNGNRRISMTYPNGVVTTTGYDNAGHVTSIKAVKGSTTYMNFTYTFSGNLKASVTDINNSPTTYTYDALNRLTEALVKNSSGSQTGDYKYSYDGAGNRTSATINGTTTSYSYNAANELTSSLQGSTTTSYTYDGNGNETSGDGLNFSYNAKNQTTAISTDSYTYNGPDQTDRVKVNSTTYSYGVLGLGSASNSGGQTYYTRDNKGELVSERTPSGTYYYLMDSLGSINTVVDSSGTTQNSYTYDPFGNSLNKTEKVGNPWQFAGGYSDSSTGLYKFGTRYYSPKLARWTQQDPVGGSIGNPNVNRYVYADDEPNMLTDPSGRCSPPTTFFDAVVFVFSALAAGAALAAVVAAIPESVVGLAFLQALGAGLFTTIPGVAAIAALGIGAGAEGLLIGCLLGAG